MITRLLVWIVMLFGGAAISIYVDVDEFKQLFASVRWHFLSFIIGVFLLRLVMKVSRNTGRTLAKFGREGEIARMETNRLVKKGVYKYMRHPMHLGLLFFPLAFAFIIGSPTFILIVWPIEAVFMLIMIKVMEEPEAIKKFNGEYLEYMKTTPWFCFRKECLKELFREIKK
jgi:protein-S-isoprenylcysteine O-methyltransferase Ste14